MGTANRASMQPLVGNHYAHSFMPGDWQVFECGYQEGLERPFHIHCSAPEPVKAEFEVAFDNVLQDFTLSVEVTLPYEHAIAFGEGRFDHTLHLRRKETDEQKPVFVIRIDGVL